VYARWICCVQSLKMTEAGPMYWRRNGSDGELIMISMVVGILALGSALAREPDDTVRDRPLRDEATASVVLPRMVDDDDASGDLASVLAPEIGVAQGDRIGHDDRDRDRDGDGFDTASDVVSASNQWEIACEIKSGSALVFDRGSLRDYGPVTLFRWSAPRTRIASPGDQIFTAVVNCREKTIEASWPGRSRETYAGTCGRGLVEAVCAASEQASAAGAAPAGIHAPGPTRASHHGTLPRR
jgi:hypothetical protein